MKKQLTVFCVAVLTIVSFANANNKESRPNAMKCINSAADMSFLIHNEKGQLVAKHDYMILPNNYLPTKSTYKVLTSTQGNNKERILTLGIGNPVKWTLTFTHTAGLYWNGVLNWSALGHPAKYELKCQYIVHQAPDVVIPPPASPARPARPGAELNHNQLSWKLSNRDHDQFGLLGGPDARRLFESFTTLLTYPPQIFVVEFSSQQSSNSAFPLSNPYSESDFRISNDRQVLCYIESSDRSDGYVRCIKHFTPGVKYPHKDY
jgi:hypothetical protein